MASDTIAVNRTVLIVGAVALLGVGAVSAWWLRPIPSPNAVAPSATVSPVTVASGPASITLSKEAADRAGVALAVVTASSEASSLRIPGTVQPNAYKNTVVTPVASGRVTRVAVELGQTVRAGAVLAEIYSPELAEARTRYVSARAELGAHELEVQRTEKLVAIGAASRQELERIHAEHTSAIAMVEGYRSKLALFGLSEADMQGTASQSQAAIFRVVAPLSGVVTARDANLGANVDPATPLFTVADLSTVWVVGEVYERDFQAVPVGAAATVTFPAYPEISLPGKVAYVAPAVNGGTRTAQVRVEVPNANGRLKLGMLSEVSIADARQPDALSIPRSAVQTVGERTVVYVSDPSDASRLTERTVTLGMAAGDQVRVVSGLRAGESVVVQGSFAVRAEIERTAPRQSSPGATAATQGGADNALQIVRVSVTEKGFEPERLTVAAGQPIRLEVTRTTDATCGKEIVIPALNTRKELPLNQAVVIDLPAQQGGELGFECGMQMLKGTFVIR